MDVAFIDNVDGEKAAWYNFAYMFSHWQLAIKGHAEKVANRIDWLHDDGVEVEAHGVELFELD